MNRERYEVSDEHFRNVGSFFVSQTHAFVNREEPSDVASERRIATALTIVDQVTATLSDGTRQVMFQLSNKTTSTATYDSLNRLITVQSSNNHLVIRYHYDSTTTLDAPIAIAVEDTESGIVSYRLTSSRKQVDGLKLAAGDEQCNSDGNCTSGWAGYPPIVENPFEAGWGGLGIAPAPEPPRCKKDDCNDLCDAGAQAGAALCRTMAPLGLVGAGTTVVCVAAMVAANWTCRARCRQCQ